MLKIKEIISLSGTKPKFRETTTPDFNNIKSNTFDKLTLLKISEQFRKVWENSKEYLSSVAKSKGTKETSNAINSATLGLFSRDNIKDNVTINDNTNHQSIKPKPGHTK